MTAQSKGNFWIYGGFYPSTPNVGVPPFTPLHSLISHFPPPTSDFELVLAATQRSKGSQRMREDGYAGCWSRPIFTLFPVYTFTQPYFPLPTSDFRLRATSDFELVLAATQRSKGSRLLL